MTIADVISSVILVVQIVVAKIIIMKTIKWRVKLLLKKWGQSPPVGKIVLGTVPIFNRKGAGMNYKKVMVFSTVVSLNMIIWYEILGDMLIWGVAGIILIVLVKS